MNPIIELMVFMFLLSVVIAYAWWTKLRIWFFRQDLFAIRDCLWDQMREKGMLDDISHRVTRDGINAMIRFAPYLSVGSMAILLTSGIHKVEMPSEDMLPEEVLAAREHASRRMTKYLFRDSLLGLAIYTMARVAISYRAACEQSAKWMGRLFDSLEIRSMRFPGQPIVCD